MQVTSGLSIFPKQEKLNSLLVHYAQVFQEGIGTLKHIKAHIAVEEDAQPKFHKARPVPYAIRPKVEAELKRLEGQGVLSKVNWSEWATPIVSVIKKNGAVRICGDFKVTINPVLYVDQYPLPRIEDIFASLAGGEYFSKIDLSQAYLQMELEESSKKYLTINTHKGLFRYNRLVFGVSSAPAMWQRAMDQVLQGIPGTQCYLDDITVTGTDNSAHLTNLEAVLTRLSEFGLKANKSKCQFFRDSLEYCGHIIDKNGLHKSPDKIDAVLKAPQPENVTQLRSFLDLVNYYHRFLPNLSTVLHPLNCLLQKGSKWEWSQDCEQVFNTAKQLITSDEVLTHFNPKLPLRLACDASPYGIGAVLSHKMLDGTERPIAFASRSLSPAEKNYAQIDREGLSLVWTVKKFNQYLYGKHFTLVTDHQPLIAIFNPHKCVPTMAAARLQRWSLFLGDHDYQIEFRGTKQHANADGLSRLPCEFKGTQNLSDPAEIFHLTQLEPLPITSAQIQKETSRDPTMAKLFVLIIKGWPSRSDADLPEYSNRREQLSVCQGCIMWGTRVIVPPKLHTKILEALHEGHLGVVKMKSLAQSYIWWPGIDLQIENLAKSCTGCQQTRRQPQRLPEQLVSDNGTQFTSAEFQAFVKKNGIKHITSVPYHPATNGLAECFIQSFKLSMKAMEKEKESLHMKIASFLLAYRNTAHSTTVLARDYRHSNQKWQPGTIVSKTGPLTYTVQVGHDTVWRRHIDQLLDAQAQEDTSQDKAEELIIPQNSNEFTFLTPDSSLAAGESQPQESAESTSSQMSAPPTQERRYPERIRKPPERLNLSSILMY
ncbi:uncharacterized protein K02A2.6-like [Erpetoichthys calabaricus]|uniref:uncharacterized protein K02A2.6-like n=1 Tax=Erpetoichthys calabaricus TaxID=27687 RepID=UPI002234C6D3|nr:uncharacterized protein K02A2.6-like [Erpetoichthys calabaricus]